MPFKALDAAVDALGAHLASLQQDEVAALLPEDTGLLAQTFPVLRRAAAVAEAPMPGREALDPKGRRVRVFAALRCLLAALAGRGPLVVVIDDLQWADADSLALLRELLREPQAPALLLILTHRARSGEAPPELHALLGAPAEALGDVRRLPLALLSGGQALALADDLLGAESAARAPGDEPLAAALAAESGGHPMFLRELVIHHRLHAGPAGHGVARLDDALWERVKRLDPPAFRLLVSAALAGGRLTQDVASRAAELAPADYARHAARLRAASLARTTGRRGSDAIEPYHDRVREAVLSHLDADERRACHLRLSVALSAAAPEQHEMLAAHWRGAGEPRKAAEHATLAAARAEEALAFDRAARFYQMALDLDPIEGPEGARVREKLGDALANAGRGAEAAEAFLAAAAMTGPGEALDLRRRAADQLLRSGHIDEALATFRVVLGAVGMDMPESPTGALAAFLIRRAQIRLRGFGFRERAEAQIPPADLTRIDTCWSASSGLGLVNTILGQYFQARCLLFALDAGEPNRVQRALAMEGAYSSSEGGKAQKRTAELLAASRAMAETLGKPYTLAFATLSEGVAATLEGRWRTAHASCDRAEATFRDRCTGVTWEVETGRWFGLWALSYLGGVAELRRRVPARLREAKERGDRYAVVCHATGLSGLAWLAEDAPDTALAEAREALARWSLRDFHVEHWWALLGERQTDLYRGDAETAYAEVHRQWGAMKRSLLLMVQLTRLEATHLRARCALALARARPARRKALCKEVEVDAHRILGERMPWSSPLALLLRAGIAATLGRPESAASLLAEANRGLLAADMALYAAAAEWQRGRILGGDEGRRRVEAAEAWMGEQGIVQPARMAAMLAPGFEG